MYTKKKVRNGSIFQRYRFFKSKIDKREGPYPDLERRRLMKGMFRFGREEQHWSGHVTSRHTATAA